MQGQLPGKIPQMYDLFQGVFQSLRGAGRVLQRIEKIQAFVLRLCQGKLGAADAEQRTEQSACKGNVSMYVVDHLQQADQRLDLAGIQNAFPAVAGSGDPSALERVQIAGCGVLRRAEQDHDISRLCRSCARFRSDGSLILEQSGDPRCGKFRLCASDLRGLCIGVRRFGGDTVQLHLGLRQLNAGHTGPKRFVRAIGQAAHAGRHAP